MKIRHKTNWERVMDALNSLRKRLSRKRRLEYDKNYRETHREELRKYNREYQRKRRHKG